MPKIIASSLVLALGTINAVPALAYSKDETVYSKVKSNGESYQTTVTEHIKNTDDLETLNDISELLNITNTNGDEEFSRENNSITWKASGNDIYYKGNTEKELPIESSIKYELDGEEIEAKDLAGKSGKIKITINYTNKEERTVRINGKTEKMYVPFVVATGTMFDNTKIKNVTVTNGKVIDNGNKTLVVALSCPGLIESLGLEDDVDIDLNKIEISFDAENFEMGNIMSAAMPKVFENADIDNLDALDDIYSQINDLKSASTQLVEGAKTLQDGTEEYVSKSTEFADGLESFNQGINTATNSYNKIDEGIDSVNSNISSIKSGANKLNQGASDLSSAIDSTMSAKLNAIMSDESLTKAEREALAKVAPKLTVTDAEKQAMSKQIGTAIDSAVAKTTKAQEAGLDKINDNEKGVKAGLKTLKTQASSSIKIGISAISSGFDSITEGTTELIAGSNELKNGTSTLSQGTSKLQTGVNTLSNGSKELKTGLSTLNSSSDMLNSANKQLLEGANTISDGAKILAEGMSEFDEEGINKIVSLVNGDVKDLQARVEKLQDLANEYNSFAGIEEENEGTTKFIFLIDAIKNNAKEEKQSTMPVENNENIGKSEDNNQEKNSGK